MKITKCMCCMEELIDETGKCPHCGFSEEETSSLPHQLPYRSVLNGTYMVGKAIGEGGFGITYIGWDLNLGIKVAIKEFYPEGFVGRDGAQSYTVRSFQGDSTVFFNNGKEKFLEEARSLGKFMQLDGIVSVKDFFLENNTVYIVMEYLEGQSLKSYAREREGKIEAEELLGIMKPVLESLMEVHKSGVIHRDISPDNIMICKDGKVKLIDFGAAREASPQGEKTLSVMLKKGYSPEEQYRTHGEQGTWTDVYALSATIYAMMTGFKPDEPLDRMENETLKPLSQMGIKLKKRQEDVLMKGLEIKASDRVQTVGELYRGLYKEGKENEFAIKRKKRGKFIVVLAVLFLSACIGAGAYYIFMPHRLKSVVWIDAQIGQNVTIADVKTQLPDGAQDIVFYMDDVMTSNLLIQSKPIDKDAYELEVHYKNGGRNIIQKLQITVLLPEIKAVTDRVTSEKGSTVEVDNSWFTVKNADYLQMVAVNDTNFNMIGVQEANGYLLNGEYLVESAAFEIDYYDLDVEEDSLLTLIKGNFGSHVEKNSELEQCADTLLDNAILYDLSDDWSNILSGSVDGVNQKYPEISYEGAFLYPMYSEGGKITYSASDFYDVLIKNGAVFDGLKSAECVGLEARTVYVGEQEAAVYWCLYYR